MAKKAMNRRGFLGLVAGGTAVAASASAVAQSDARPETVTVPGPALRRGPVEPIPTRWDFPIGDPAFINPTVDSDLSVHGVMWALAALGWDSETPVVPRLCVHPANYRSAIYARDAVRGGLDLEIYATQKINDHDAWFVVLHGRRAGSGGS